MRRDTAVVLAGYMAFMALVFWACGTQGTNSPSSFASPIPIGPKPIPVGPAPRPIGPGGPSTSPSSSPSPGPTGSPSTVPCPPTLSINAVGTPMLMSAAGNNDNLFPAIAANYDLSCQVKDVKVSLYVTTVTGFTIGFDDPTASLDHCGATPGSGGCSSTTLYYFGLPTATGNSLGSNCSDFAFDTAAPPPPWDSTALRPPPYSGTYQLDPLRQGAGQPWFLRSLHYGLSYVFYHPADAVLQCARIDIKTQVVPYP